MAGNVMDFTVGIKNAPFKRGLNEVKDEAGKVRAKIQRDFSRNTFGAISGAIAGAFTIGAVKGFLDYFSKIQHQAQRFGASAVDIQKVGKAAEVADVELNSVTKSTLKLATAAVKAADGGKKQQKQFAALNVDAATFAKSDLAGRVLLLAAGYDEAAKSGDKLDAFIGALGPKAGALIPLLAQGSTGLKKLFDESPALGDGAVERIAKFNEKLKEMQGRISGVAVAAAKMFEKQAIKAGGGLGVLGALFEVNSSSIRERLATAKAVIDAGRFELAAKDAEYADKVNPGGGHAEEEDEEEIEEKKRIAQLRGEIEEATRKAKLEQLELDERINELYRERDALLKDADDKSEDGLKNQIKALQIGAEATKLEEERGDAIERHAKKVAGLQAKQEDELTAARAKHQEQDDKNAFDALPDNAAKRKFLEGKQARLTAEAKALEEKASFEEDYTDDGKAAIRDLLTRAEKKKLAAAEITPEIAGLKDDMEKPRRREGRVFASQFAEAGLGGNAASNRLGDQQLQVAQQMRNYLAQIAASMGANAPKPRGSGFSDERHSRRH